MDLSFATPRFDSWIHRTLMVFSLATTAIGGIRDPWRAAEAHASRRDVPAIRNVAPPATIELGTVTIVGHVPAKRVQRASSVKGWRRPMHCGAPELLATSSWQHVSRCEVF